MTQRVLFKPQQHLFDSELPDLFIEDAAIEFTGDVWRSLCKPCVYVASNETEVLYVGLSDRGLSRPFSPDHHKLKASPCRDAVASLKVYPCKTLGDARKAERILIAALNPKWNDRQRLSTRYRNRINALIEAVT